MAECSKGKRVGVHQQPHCMRVGAWQLADARAWGVPATYLGWQSWHGSISVGQSVACWHDSGRACK
jgi:hypothetical protein